MNTVDVLIYKLNDLYKLFQLSAQAVFVLFENGRLGADKDRTGHAEDDRRVRVRMRDAQGDNRRQLRTDHVQSAAERRNVAAEREASGDTAARHLLRLEHVGVQPQPEKFGVHARGRRVRPVDVRLEGNRSVESARSLGPRKEQELLAGLVPGHGRAGLSGSDRARFEIDQETEGSLGRTLARNDDRFCGIVAQRAAKREAGLLSSLSTGFFCQAPSEVREPSGQVSQQQGPTHFINDGHGAAAELSFLQHALRRVLDFEQADQRRPEEDILRDARHAPGQVREGDEEPLLQRQQRYLPQPDAHKPGGAGGHGAKVRPRKRR